MKKTFTFLAACALCCTSLFAQQPSPIEMKSVATFNAAFDPSLPDTIIKKLPYSTDLGVRRVIVADANNDGLQEIIATDYTNGGRVHVMRPSASDPNKIEIIWSSPVGTGSSGSTPRYPQVGDCDGDGNPEVIFEQNSSGRIVFYEWIDDTQMWGTEPAFEITSDIFKAAGAPGPLRLTRETLLVSDIDGDGKSEIVPHGNTPAAKGVYILGIDGEFPGFASVVLEGGHPSTVHTNGDAWAGGSYWNSVPADIDGDGKIELVNHHWDYHSFWSIDVNGPDSYTYPDTSLGKNFYAHYSTQDAVNYFGVCAVDVNGDGQDEIAGTMYSDNFDLGLLSFAKTDTGVYIWKNDDASKTARFAKIALKKDLAALAGKTAAEFWPTVRGDLNKDGKDEIYTGGGRGLNLIAVQYKGTGSLLDPASYTSNIVYNGEGGDVFATLRIYNGRIDTVVTGTDTSYVLDPTKIDTVKEETPFTSFVYADSVDLDKDGKYEIVLSEQSVYDSTTVVIYNWVDSTRSFERDLQKSKKIYNAYRKTVRVLEYEGTSGFSQRDYEVVRPEDYVLEQNYPNPFNPETRIKFILPLDKKISLKIYDMLGREVATLINDQVFKKGNYEQNWNGTDNFGRKVVSGHYIARLTYGTYAKSIKMTLLK